MVVAACSRLLWKGAVRVPVKDSFRSSLWTDLATVTQWKKAVNTIRQLFAFLVQPPGLSHRHDAVRACDVASGPGTTNARPAYTSL